jgi:Fe2+ transport system protein FeoA
LCLCRQNGRVCFDVKLNKKGKNMSIVDMNIGDKAKVVDIHAQKDLKLRLQSLGLAKGADIEVRGFAIGKQNVELLVDDTLVGLRQTEMRLIEVEMPKETQR